jgi:23S rRNA pseudouridine2605 synthase
MANVEREDSRVHQEAVRLNRYLALAGVGSRRKNDELILSGAVKVNGKVVQQLGVRVRPNRDRVTVHGNPVGIKEKAYYILFNKPKDCITTLSDERGRTTVMDYVRVRERIFPIGRLDRNTVGVLLLTNDGELAHGLMHPRRAIERVYRVRLDRSIRAEDFRKLRQGVRLEDGKAKPKGVSLVPQTRHTELLLALEEGRNREVKRIFEALGYDLKKLERIAFAGLTTEGVARGKWRFLTQREVSHLKELAGLSH